MSLLPYIRFVTRNRNCSRVNGVNFTFTVYPSRVVSHTNRCTVIQKSSNKNTFTFLVLFCLVVLLTILYFTLYRYLN